MTEEVQRNLDAYVVSMWRKPFRRLQARTWSEEESRAVEHGHAVIQELLLPIIDRQAERIGALEQEKAELVWVLRAVEWGAPGPAKSDGKYREAVRCSICRGIGLHAADCIVGTTLARYPEPAP